MSKVKQNRLGYRPIILALKATFLAVFILLFMGVVEADFRDDGSCEEQTDCQLSIFIVNITNAEPVSDARCNITIINPNGTTIINVTTGGNNFTNFTGGLYNYTINFGITGLYPSKVSCFCSTSHCLLNGSDVGDVSFVIGTPQNFDNYLYTFLALLPFGLFIFARKYDHTVLIMLSGIILATFGVALYGNLFDFLKFESTLPTQAFAIMILAIGLYIIGRVSIELAGEARIDG